MEIVFRQGQKKYRASLKNPIDISIPIQNGMNNPNCFWAPPPEFSPVRTDSFVGSTSEGGIVNFFNIKINPHGNGTHTECVGHISQMKYSINKCLKSFHHLVKLVTVFPTKQKDGDRVILKEQLEEVFSENEAPAIALRTQPNDDLKRVINYSGANPPYLHPEAVKYLTDCGVEHLLVDLPSVDREEDGGKLSAHKAFWYFDDKIRENCTITELFYATDDIKDDLYLLEFQVLNIDLDVSPSRPILYKIEEIDT